MWANLVTLPALGAGDPSSNLGIPIFIMEKKKISAILFYDKNGNVLLQDRKDISKRGEEYGFFGGHREKGENSEETLRRELREEIGIDIGKLKNLEFFKKYKLSLVEFNLDVDIDFYLAEIPQLKKLNVREGKPIIMNIRDTFSLKMVPGDVELLKEIYKFLRKQNTF